MLKLYGITRSRAARCLWMLEELGIPYERERLGTQEAGSSAAYLALNPNGRVPTLEDDGTVLFESLAINLYLAEKYAGTHAKGLWPSAVADHGRCAQWSLWAMTELEAHLLAALRNRAILPEGERSEEVAGKAEESLRRPLAALERALDGRSYLLGTAFTVADLNVAAVLSWALRAKIALQAYPTVQGWLTRCLERPAQQRVLADARAAS